MPETMLAKRRQELGITISSLARMSKVPVATVNRILAEPGTVGFDSVAAVGKVLGVNYTTVEKVPVKSVLKKRALTKAQYVAKIVQGTQGLEAAGVDSDGYQKLVSVALETLLSGKRRRLWDEE